MTAGGGVGRRPLVLGDLLAGAALGWRSSLPSMLLYLLAGMAGMPWFAGHGHGIHFPSLGYVIGFVLAGTVVGALAARGGDRTPLRTLGLMVLGDALIYWSASLTWRSTCTCRWATPCIRGCARSWSATP